MTYCAQPGLLMGFFMRQLICLSAEFTADRLLPWLVYQPRLRPIGWQPPWLVLIQPKCAADGLAIPRGLTLSSRLRPEGSTLFRHRSGPFRTTGHRWSPALAQLNAGEEPSGCPPCPWLMAMAAPVPRSRRRDVGGHVPAPTSCRLIRRRVEFDLVGSAISLGVVTAGWMA